MKIVLFTHDGPIFMPRYLEPVIKQLGSSVHDIVLAPKSEGTLAEAKRRHRMFGTPTFARFSVKYAKNRLFDLLPSEIMANITGRYYSVYKLAKSYGVPIREVEDINAEEFISQMENIHPDLFLSIACDQIMGESLLEIPEHGAVNVHGSLLPKYRGVATAFWVLYNGEEEGGVTAHYMTSEIDAGDILVQQKFPIDDGDSMYDVYRKVSEVGADVAIKAVKDIESGTVTTTSNNTKEGDYYSFPDEEDRNEFLRRGNKFI